MLTKRWWLALKRFFIGLLVALFAISLTGLVYQTTTSEADRRNFPPPGNLIDVGGFKLHIHCVGTGSPTVVLDAMAGGFSSYWAWIQPELAEQVRVCAYDRAGFGWSDPDPEPESPQRTATTLHTLLANAGLHGPFILVGHSKGGLYVREYAAQYPEDVAGLVLLDAAHPDQFVRHPDWLQGETSLLGWMPLIQTLLRLGVGHAYFALGGEADFAGLPQRQHDEIAAAWSSPAYWEHQAASMALGRSIYQQAETLGSLGDLPLMVVTRGTDLERGWGELQAELAGLSTNSRQLVIEGSTHASLTFNPEHAQQVSAAILQVVAAVQTGRPLNR